MCTNPLGVQSAAQTVQSGIQDHPPRGPAHTIGFILSRSPPCPNMIGLLFSNYPFHVQHNANSFPSRFVLAKTLHLNVRPYKYFFLPKTFSIRYNLGLTNVSSSTKPFLSDAISFSWEKRLQFTQLCPAWSPFVSYIFPSLRD